MSIIQMRRDDSINGLMEMINYINSFSPVSEMTMVEIGCYAGESTEIFAKHFKHVIAIDPHLSGYDNYDLASNSDYNLVKSKFLEVKQKYNNIDYINLSSDDAIEILKNSVFDFVYIDGNHTYDQVRKDIENYLTIVNFNGFIGGHDYNPDWKSVIDAVWDSLGYIDFFFSDYSWIKHKSNVITVVYTYYGQKERIQDIVNQKLKTIIIDDCYPEPLESINGVDIYRVTDDIKWNQPGARNLGFNVAEGWVICADIDHLVTREMIEKLTKMKLARNNIYFLGREDNYMLHNFFLVHKDDFELMGGWDEDFCGNYGFDDFYFGVKSKKILNPVYLTDIKSKIYKESSSNGVRNTWENFKLLQKKLRGDYSNTPRLRFNWIKVK